MAMTQARRLTPRAAAGLSIVCWAVLTVLQVIGVFEIPDLKVFDLRHRLRGQRPASDAIAVVEVDDRTVQAYQNRWPLPRDQYAVLIAALEEGGAAAVGFDLLFLSGDPGDPHGDSTLAVLSSQFENVVHSALFVEAPSLQGGAALPPGVDEALQRHGITADGVRAATAGIVTLPYAQLGDSARAIAHSSVVVDRDGVVRRLPLLLRHGERLYPSLSLGLFAASQGEDATPNVTPKRGGFGVRWRRGDPEKLLPMENTGASAMDFAGDREAFARRVAMIDVVQWYKSDSTARLHEAFQGRIVLIGSTAVSQAAADVGSTPFSEATPGVYVHANALNALISGRFLRAVSARTVVLVLAVVSILLGLLLPRLPVPWAASTTIGTMLLVIALDYVLFVLWGLDIPATMALLLPPFTYATVEGFAFFSLEQETRTRERELQVARGIQTRLLPSTVPDVAELDIYGVNIPAQEVGGDYYDWIAMGDGTLAIILGDVSGKGVSAALLMSHLRASMHAEVRAGATPASVAQAVHESLFRATEPSRFATCFLVFVSPSTNEVCYCSAGHNPAFLVRGGIATPLRATGFPLGLVEGAQYEERREILGSGDLLVIYSDGVTECPWKDELYGEERLVRVVRELAARGLPAVEVGNGIIADVKGFCHGRLGADDVTLVVARRR